MSQRNKYWDAIIEQYKVSGLSQPAFCKHNELSYNQFQYRWYLHNRMKKVKIGALDKSSSFAAGQGRSKTEACSPWEP